MSTAQERLTSTADLAAALRAWHQRDRVRLVKDPHAASLTSPALRRILRFPPATWFLAHWLLGGLKPVMLGLLIRACYAEQAVEAAFRDGIRQLRHRRRRSRFLRPAAIRPRAAAQGVRDRPAGDAGGKAGAHPRRRDPTAHRTPLRPRGPRADFGDGGSLELALRSREPGDPLLPRGDLLPEPRNARRIGPLDRGQGRSRLAARPRLHAGRGVRLARAPEKCARSSKSM